MRLRFSLLSAFCALFLSMVAPGQSVSANFGNRDGSTLQVAPGLLGVGGVGSTLSNAAAISLVAATGLNQDRIFLEFNVFDTTGTPDYSLIDAQMGRAQNAGFHPLVVLSNSPPSLGASACTVPSSISAWATLAASVVAHLDAKYPGLVQDYEIWNEPDSQASLCAGSTSANLSAYLSIYAAAGAAIRAQAATDHATVRIGGPTLAAPGSNLSWITSLTTTSATSPYVDFVSLHIYITGQSDITSGMTWSTLYGRTQSSTQGFEHYYQAAEALVRAGSQPNAATTPIYVTEFNDNSYFGLDCCRSDAAYGPLWNTLAISDMLNAGYSGASTLPAKLLYFAASASGSYFCLVGNLDGSMDCAPSTYAAYPQYYAYKLFASPQFLNLEGGAHMAVSVSPASTASGLTATAFYTATSDTVVIVNPTATAYTALPVSLANSGFSRVSGKVFTLNSANPTISTATAALSGTAMATTAVAVPAYSTVAVTVSQLLCH